MIRSIAIVTMSAALAACAAPEKKPDLWQQRFNASIPVCSGEAQCKTMWDAAQVWVVQNARMKIQVATDAIIETYNPKGMNLAVRAVKKPIGGGKHRIEVSVWCANVFGCTPKKRPSAMDFNRTVSRAGQT